VVIELVRGAEAARSVEEELGDRPAGMKLCPTLKVCNLENLTPSGIRDGGGGTPASMKMPNSSKSGQYFAKEINESKPRVVALRS